MIRPCFGSVLRSLRQFVPREYLAGKLGYTKTLTIQAGLGREARPPSISDLHLSPLSSSTKEGIQYECGRLGSAGPMLGPFDLTPPRYTLYKQFRYATRMFKSSSPECQRNPFVGLLAGDSFLASIPCRGSFSIEDCSRRHGVLWNLL